MPRDKGVQEVVGSGGPRIGGNENGGLGGETEGEGGRGGQGEVRDGLLGRRTLYQT